MSRAAIATAALLSLSVSSTTSLAAEQCDVPVVDEAHVISDVGAVEHAAASLALMGITVRVRTYESVESVIPIPSDLDRYVLDRRAACDNWRNSPSTWKSTLLLLAFAPNDHGQLGAYFGVSNSARFGDGKWQDVLRDRFVPQVQAYKQGDKTAITTAFVSSLSEFKALYAKPSTGGNTVIKEETDYSGVFKIFFIILGLVGAGGLFLLVLSRRGVRQAAQAEARRARSACISGLLSITDEQTTELLQLKVNDNVSGLEPKLARYKKLGERGLQSFATFDSLSASDPNDRKLSVDAYNANKKSYEQITADYVLPAQRLANDINEGRTEFSNADLPRSDHPRRPRPYMSVRATSSPESPPATPASAPPAPAPQTTTVVQTGGGGGDFLSGMLVGDLLSSHSRRDSDPAPAPSRHSRDSDSRSDSGSDGGGSFSSDSSGSSDSGGSFSSDSGSSSDSGGSFSSSC